MATHALPHRYPIAKRDSGLFAAISLMIMSLPYALMRFAILFGAAVAAILWLTLTFGGAAWLGTHIASAFGIVWFLGGIGIAGYVWVTILRYSLHLVECGHVAVLTRLITHGQLESHNESMFAYGRRIVTERFGQVNALFGMNILVRGGIATIHNALEGLGQALPIPDIGAIVNIITAVLKAATRYMDKVIFSYNLAVGDCDPWKGAQEGIIYYAQNAKPILKQSIWIVFLEYFLTAMLCIALLVPAGAVTVMMPSAVREWGGLFTVIMAALVAFAARGAFLKPTFLIMIMVRFHVLTENQVVDPTWASRLESISTKFRELGARATSLVAGFGAGTPSAVSR
jgi:hypothetical protein